MMSIQNNGLNMSQIRKKHLDSTFKQYYLIIHLETHINKQVDTHVPTLYMKHFTNLFLRSKLIPLIQNYFFLINAFFTTPT